MLPGFLTTALEIIIILDICGAIAYFTITGLTRLKDKKETLSPVMQNATAGLPAFATEAGQMPADISIPERVSATVYHPATNNTPPQEPPTRQWTAGLKQRLSSMTRKFTYKPAAGGQTVQTQNIDADYAKLGRVLDSFKEET